MSKLQVIKETLANEGKVQKYAEECFTMFDVDGNELLTFDELHECMKHMNRNLGIPEFRPRDVANYMRRFDTNMDCHLNATEFKEVYRYLLLVKLNEEEPTPFCRDMFVGQRQGQPCDHYNIEGIVGSGNFGVVSKVNCKETRNVRVMKTINKEKAMRSGLPPRLVMEEINRLKTLDHPAILRLFEYFADAQAIHLVCDHLQGGELMQSVHDAHRGGRPLTEEWVRGVFHQVCGGVAYIHGKGVMHRDLKLDNIMLGSVDPPHAVIIDVGLAELFPAHQPETFKSKNLTGSIPTMAPEVIRRSSNYKCDVWSLGCCLFGLVCKAPVWFTGHSGRVEMYPYPFLPAEDGTVGDPLEIYLERQRQGPDLANTLCSESCRDLIDKMLEFQERSRLSMRHVLAHEWFDRDDQRQQPPLAPAELDALVNFPRSSALVEAVLLVVASQLPVGELHELREIFALLDTDNNGRLDAGELALGMVRAGLGPAEAEEASRRIASRGAVEFSRFIAALVPSRRELLMPHFRAAFNRLDVDGDGFVTASELRQVLTNGRVKHQKASQAVISMLEELGGGSRISFDSLHSYFRELCA